MACIKEAGAAGFAEVKTLSGRGETKLLRRLTGLGGGFRRALPGTQDEKVDAALGLRGLFCFVAELFGAKLFAPATSSLNPHSNFVFSFYTLFGC